MDCLQSYAGDARRYDELLDDAGEVRSHWRPLLDRLVNDGPEAARRHMELARHLIVENGVTYNVYADPKGKDRPWILDPLPFLLQTDEWREIEAGVTQRAELLDAVLADLYGPQRLLSEGLVPPEIAFGHPNFLWPCHGICPADGRWLHLYAADLARGSDGRWWVLGDRTQTPSGTGYALENRHIVTRLFPELLEELDVRPLDDFFAGIRDGLLAARCDGAESLAVVLTPGPFNETYFEHAYLARQLGLPLVEGQDLTVRGDVVHLKTLGGLRRVNAVFRRLDDDFCDPLELRSDSALGVPGLIRAVRAGNVVVANALGSGVLESAAWLGFLPGVARHLRNEDLRLPSVATWWCGEEPALEYVIAHLDRLVLKPTYPNQRFEAVFGRDLDGEDRAALSERLRGRPHAYVAQERMSLSQAPVWDAGGALRFRARSVGIRVYAVATPDGYRIMPGGMARIAAGKLADVLSAQRGGGSKDVWVLRSGSSAQLPASAPPRRSTPRVDDLPSRLAENLYWFGRYAERCENKTRLLRATLAVRSRPETWSRALETCRWFGVAGASGFFADDDLTGLPADLRRLGQCATEVRSRLSGQNWRIANRLAGQLQRSASAVADPRETLDRLLGALSALAGLAYDDMTQDDGWRLMILGRRLERLQFLALLLSRPLSPGTPLSQRDLEWLLDISDGTISYRTRFLSAPRLGPVLDLLVHEPRNPRALAYQWLAACQLVADLSASLGDLPVDALGAAMRALSETRSLALEGPDDLAVQARWTTGTQLANVATAAGDLSDALSARHFSHTHFELRMVAT